MRVLAHAGRALRYLQYCPLHELECPLRECADLRFELRRIDNCLRRYWAKLARRAT